MTGIGLERGSSYAKRRPASLSMIAYLHSSERLMRCFRRKRSDSSAHDQRESHTIRPQPSHLIRIIPKKTASET